MAYQVCPLCGMAQTGGYASWTSSVTEATIACLPVWLTWLWSWQSGWCATPCCPSHVSLVSPPWPHWPQSCCSPRPAPPGPHSLWLDTDTKQRHPQSPQEQPHQQILQPEIVSLIILLLVKDSYPSWPLLSPCLFQRSRSPMAAPCLRSHLRLNKSVKSWS